MHQPIIQHIYLQILFTMKKENNNLFFPMNILVKKSHFQFIVDAYYKPTFPGLYPWCHSFNSTKRKITSINIFFRRVLINFSTWKFSGEHGSIYFIIIQLKMDVMNIKLSRCISTENSTFTRDKWFNPSKCPVYLKLSQVLLNLKQSLQSEDRTRITCHGLLWHLVLK